MKKIDWKPVVALGVVVGGTILLVKASWGKPPPPPSPPEPSPDEGAHP